MAVSKIIEHQKFIMNLHTRGRFGAGPLDSDYFPLERCLFQPSRDPGGLGWLAAVRPCGALTG